MSDTRAAHLVERAVERMAELGLVTPGAPLNAAANAFANAATDAPINSRVELLAGVANAPSPVGNSPVGEAPAGVIEPDAPTADAPVRELPLPKVTPTIGGAAIPAIGMATLEAAGLVVSGTRRSRIAEEWNVTAGRLLRTQRTIRRSAGGASSGTATVHVTANLLMITSSKPDEGKSFSALNLAGSLALGGMTEVLLMDTDSKPGALTELLGVKDRLGLFDLAVDPSLRPEDLVLATAIPNFAVLPIGRASKDGASAADRTVTRPVVTAIEAVARRFPNRIVIMDTAPCLATSDATTLAGTVGQIAMIVEAERTQRDDLEAALELLRPCTNITLLLNKVRAGAAHSFGDYYYYNG